MKGIFLGLGKGENKYRVYSVQLGRFFLEPPKKLRGVGAMNFAFTLLLGLREAFNKKSIKSCGSYHNWSPVYEDEEKKS